MKIELPTLTVLSKKITVAACVALLVGCAGSGGNKNDGGDFDGSGAADDAASASAIDDSETTQEFVEVDAVDLETVFYFDFDQASLNTATRAALDAQAAVLRKNNQSVRLEGHADERGTREYNLALGEKRAKAVADYLAIQGISRSRIEVVSYGEERPVSLEASESAWGLNRRVELK